MNTTHLEHGVFVVIFALGVLIRGQPGIGKSSLALELIDRGHAFVSDDVVQIKPSAELPSSESTDLFGSAPTMLQNLLAVRDIGVLNITEIYPSATVLAEHRLDFIVQLEANPITAAQEITNPYHQRLILGHKFPSQTICAHSNRNLALIVETATKNYILYKNGQDAGRALRARQQQYL